VVGDGGEVIDSESQKKLSGVAKEFYILTAVLVTWVGSLVKHIKMYFKSLHFTVYKFILIFKTHKLFFIINLFPIS
jgi:hypothetical protein